MAAWDPLLMGVILEGNTMNAILEVNSNELKGNSRETQGSPRETS